MLLELFFTMSSISVAMIIRWRKPFYWKNKQNPKKEKGEKPSRKKDANSEVITLPAVPQSQKIEIEKEVDGQIVRVICDATIDPLPKNPRIVVSDCTFEKLPVLRSAKELEAALNGKTTANKNEDSEEMEDAENEAPETKSSKDDDEDSDISDS